MEEWGTQGLFLPLLPRSGNVVLVVAAPPPHINYLLQYTELSPSIPMNIYYLTVSENQESGSSSAGWFWPRVCHKIPIKTSAEPAVI